jgi:ribonuclease R
VILDRILVQERRLQFSIVEEGISLTGRTPAKPVSKKNRRTNTATASVKGKKGFGKKGKRR